jgi:hypothetical protein
MKRKLTTVSEVKALLTDVEVALFSLQRLYTYKVWFRNSSKLNDKVIKTHMTFHFVFEIIKTGSLRNTDALIYEHKHVDVKQIYKSSSRRIHELVIEMWTQMQTSKLINMAVNRYCEKFGNYAFPVRAELDKTQILYTTTAGIDFTWSLYNSKSQQFTYDKESRTILPIGGNYTTPFVNPLINVKALWYEIAKIRGLREFIDRFVNGSKGMSEQ